MNNVLEVKFSGWTATPRMPFILSGNAVCMQVPSYSMLLGVIGCCLGRVVQSEEISLGYKYNFGATAMDMETRHRLEFDGRKVKPHTKGTDAYQREFHTMPKLTIWVNRPEWKVFFDNPVGTPSLGRSQDILTIDEVRVVAIEAVNSAKISGCMLPYNSTLKVGGQLLQIAEAFIENDEVGQGRTATKSNIFIAIPSDKESEVQIKNLYQTIEAPIQSFYMHNFNEC
jgi:CRISPR-associated protein Cas5t